MIPQLLLFALCAVPSQGYALRQGVTPVQKVIALLQDMMAKGKAEKADEATKFTRYKQFCDDTTRVKQEAIADANALMEALQADIQKAESDAAVLAEKIAELDQEIAAFEADKKAATDVREKEHADYQVTHADYSESVDSLTRATQVLKRQQYDRGQALLQVAMLKRIPASAKRTIYSFLAMDSEVVQDPLSVSAPQANAYEFQAGGIVDMIAKLEDKFKDERNSLEKDEMQAKFAFEKVVQDLVSSIKKATKQRGRDAATKSEREQAAAEAKGDLAETTQSRDEDTAYLNDLTAQCASKSNDFAARQQLRAEELEAITKAVEILASGSVTGMSEKHLPQLVQTSFALRASTTLTPVQRNVAAFLQDRAAKLQSRVLSMVAAKVTEDPFVKVKKMIKDLIVRLMEEANEESEHKGWCDQELSTNKQTRDTKSSQVEELTSTKDALTAEIAKLMEQAADLTAAIASIDAAVAEATAQRQAESAKNKETIKDAQEAQIAVSQALAVLKEFYAKAATATALVQQPEVDAPETFDKAYKGMGGESGGVLGMLEVIQSDFSRLEVETTAEEEEASDAFERFSAESDKDKSVKNKTLQHKINTKASKNGDLMDCVKDLKATQEELDAALAYFDKLKPNCVDAGVSYADRVQRREDEIESLQEALRILEGQDIA
jgi:hypothetical protein